MYPSFVIIMIEHTADAPSNNSTTNRHTRTRYPLLLGMVPTYEKRNGDNAYRVCRIPPPSSMGVGEQMLCHSGSSAHHLNAEDTKKFLI